jgi:hypothetical protein
VCVGDVALQVLEAVAGHRGLRNKFALAETIYRVTDDFFFARQKKDDTCAPQPSTATANEGDIVPQEEGGLKGSV